MNNRIRIMVGVACYRPWQQFTKSLSELLIDSSLKYDISCYQVYGKQLVDAQNEIADIFMKSDYEYLLMIEDDMWDFNVQMLDDLMVCDAMVVGMKYYSRHYPYVVIPMVRNSSIEEGKFEMNILGCSADYAQVGLVGFGMTLIKKEVFRVLDKPFFRRNTRSDGTEMPGYATDQDFCSRVERAGLKLMGCFKHCVTHRGLTNETVCVERDKGIGGTGKWKNWQDYANKRAVALRKGVNV